MSPSPYKTIEEIAAATPLKGRCVFVRVDFNVPYDAQAKKILDDTRIQETLPTIQFLKEHKAKIILGSHLGRPKGKDASLSLLEVAERLSALLKQDVVFPEDCVGDGIKKLCHDLPDGGVLLLENLRFHAEEEANDADFAKKLAALAEIFITDAFGVLHRAHASTSGMVSHFKEKGIGFLVKHELELLEKLREPQRPYVAILGGAKVSDKIGLIESLVSKVDSILLGGGLAYTFLKAMDQEVAQSRVQDEKLFLAHKIIKKAEDLDVKIYLPQDHCVADRIDPNVPGRIVKVMTGSDMGLDIGPETCAAYQDVIRQAKTIFWNGPMGVFELPAFAKGTNAVAHAIAETDALSVVGGGESVAAINQAGLADRITHLSTGGGATLKFLEGKDLPGLIAVRS